MENDRTMFVHAFLNDREHDSLVTLEWKVLDIDHDHLELPIRFGITRSEAASNCIHDTNNYINFAEEFDLRWLDISFIVPEDSHHILIQANAWDHLGAQTTQELLLEF